MQVPAPVVHHEEAKEFFTIIPKDYVVKETIKDEVQLNTVTKLDKLQYVKSVIVVWNDQTREPATAEHWPKIHVPIHFVRAKEDSMNERFRPLDLIETNAVFSMDDDFEVGNEVIELSFRIWQSNPETIVGPNARLALFNKEKEEFEYLTENECMYNIILTSGAFMHRSYLASYWSADFKQVRDYVSTVKNCEDLAMNFVVQHYSRKEPIKSTHLLRSSGRFEKPSKLSLRPNHLDDRAKCLKMLRRFFSYNPLITTEHRVDSLHYNHEHLKCYNNV
ncbi:unnamed protein product [Bursaphelenchus okinawaensis]|uniref:Glycosyl transferase 64 domain-containing protein n=1 Tax=Bursaphelenchus okinawaensis TaxID=465554 RepID=A0A811LQ75_9BILA|nr:unnamed protein product [Bursaphelenchus okinawaensis]CAG9127264.1 unnamed protein product [Bursaphelenchus okinawaensis]